MKVTFPRSGSAADSSNRPGFDVLMAVTGARQSATPTAQQVAANRAEPDRAANAGQRVHLLAHGRLAPGTAPTMVACFADIAPVLANPGHAVEDMAMKINGLFTRAFQPMVKHGDVKPYHKTGAIDGAGSGME